MPTTNFIEVSLAEVPSHLHYDGDKDHERHKFHEIEPVKFVGRADEESFLWGIRRMMRIVHPFQRELDSVKAGLAWVIAFAPGSFPTDEFVHRAEIALVKIVGCRQYARSLHGGLNGQADLHLLHPTHDLDVPIASYRTRHVNLLGRVRAEIDKLTAKENEQLEGKAPLPSPIEAQRVRRKTAGVLDLEELIASIRPERGGAWFAALKKTLDAHGITNWDIDPQLRLVIPRPAGRRKKKKRPLVFDIAEQLTDELRIDRDQSSPAIHAKDREKRNTPPHAPLNPTHHESIQP